MPRLKQLELQGFKSFAEPLTVVYPTGITAIIGPNGSGKSNVSDAIRWVLGEQRMRSLRGHTGEDMIFAGSKKRARAGMARVALTFDNSDQWLPVEFAEVTIERQTYRDGKTDYILNGSKVRLMDLRDILDRAGLGRDAYLFIGQGLVDQVLSLRPAERLALFEQAAGIAPYRNRREDALTRLEETRRNLDRVRDIVGEIEPRLRRLERQVERVEQHAELTAVLRETLMTWYGYRWEQALSNLENARQRVAYQEAQAFRRLEAVEMLEADVAALRHQIVERRAHLADLHREGSQRHAEAEGLQRDLAVKLERRRSLQDRYEESRANLVPLRTALEAGEGERAALEADLAEAQARLAEARADLAEAEAAHQEVEQKRHALLRAQSEAQSRALESRHRLADRQSRLEQLADRVAQLDKRVLELEAALEKASGARGAQQSAVEEARRVFEASGQACEALDAEETRQRVAQQAARAEVDRLRQAFADKQAEHHKLAARLEVLERLHIEGAGLYAGVHAALRASESGQLEGLMGTMASLIRVPPELDRAIEVALGSQLQHIVATRWEDAKAAVAWLKRQRAGRATFLPLDTLRSTRPLDLPDLPGVVGLAAELVAYDAQIRPAVFLALGRTAVAEALEPARSLHRALRRASRGGFQIVTLEGEILRSSGSLTGGEDRRRKEGSLLARERERRELPAQIVAFEEELHALRAALQQCEHDSGAIAQALQQVVERRRAAEQARQEAERQLDRAVRDLETLIQEAEWQRKLLDEAGQERERLLETRERLTAGYKAAAAALEEAEGAIKAAAQALSTLDDGETASILAERKTQVALRDQERESRRVLLETRNRELKRLAAQIAAHEQRGQGLQATLSELEQNLAALESRYQQSRSAADALVEQIPPLEAEVAALEQRQTALEEAESESRHILRDAEQRLSQAEVEANRREDQAQALRREIEEALGIVISDLPETLSAQQPLPLTAIVSPLPKVDELPEGLERQLRDRRTQIRRLEPINPAAKEEYDEVSERHHFLREQMGDLETAAAHLRQIIAELDEMMDKSFRTTFRAIAVEFSRIFKTLFNGGTAKLTLAEDEGEIVGVDIMARPPGKRTSGLGMLSGGERTLTAVGLLFAVLLVSPTPFCILDEVDAMLDEANVSRFRAMLHELSRQTQFIIITHNRGTVEAADTIYGVSMGDNGISQVLSLSLEDLPQSEDLI